MAGNPYEYIINLNYSRHISTYKICHSYHFQKGTGVLMKEPDSLVYQIMVMPKEKKIDQRLG